jgi:zinc transport system permease protein
MSGFWQTLFDPQIHFLRNAMIAGILSCVAFGVVGSYVVVRRVSYLAGAIAHSVLCGVGFALFMRGRFGWMWLDPTVGALAAGLLSALAVWWVSIRAKEREDSVIGAIWSVGMGAGLLFLAATPGYVDPMSYLFGDVLLVGDWQTWMVAALDAVVLVVALLYYNRFKALSFDEEFCVVRGISSNLHSLLLLFLVAVTVVMLMSVVGIVLVIALLTLPAAAAGRFSRSLGAMMAGATIVGVFCVPTGIALSFVANLPAGPVVVIVLAVAYALSWIVAPLVRRQK